MWPLALLFAALAFWWIRGAQEGPGLVAGPTIRPIPKMYQPDRAMGYLNQLCDLGPRPTGSDAMALQQQMLEAFFQEQGALVIRQEERIRHPVSGEAVLMTNLIARWGVDRPRRYLLCAHYDTRPFPSRDRENPRGVFLGANDGASGTAALMELSHHCHSLPSDIGVDIVLFDAEELVYEEGRDDYFLGSTHFARLYRAQPPSVSYQAGILLDMVGDRELRFLYDRVSLRYARTVAKSIWRTAKRLGVNAFADRTRMQEIRDDHVPLNEIAGIPTVDIIDFDYPRSGFGAPNYWHTTQDVPANCSGESLAAVVWVVHSWLLEQSVSS
ncbi:MAG: M28 family peptidase [Planctomycetota bacterium]